MWHNVIKSRAFKAMEGFEHLCDLVGVDKGDSGIHNVNFMFTCRCTFSPSGIEGFLLICSMFPLPFLKGLSRLVPTDLTRVGLTSLPGGSGSVAVTIVKDGRVDG